MLIQTCCDPLLVCNLYAKSQLLIQYNIYTEMVFGYNTKHDILLLHKNEYHLYLNISIALQNEKARKNEMHLIQSHIQTQSKMQSNSQPLLNHYK